jgi:nickel/cobalt transporter (NicO) family protein
VTAVPALLAAAAGVGLAHAVLPDHWAPLAVVARTRRYPLTRVARLSALAGVAHVFVSVILGAVVIVVGLEFRSAIQSAQNGIVGGLLIATGLGFIVLEATGHGYDHDHDHSPGARAHSPGARAHSPGARAHSPGAHQRGVPPEAAGAQSQSRAGSLAALMVPFGAAASPDLTILPVFLAAAAVGPGAAVGSLLVFAAVTIAAIVSLTLLAAAGGYQIRGQWLERWGNVLTGAVLVAIGCLVLFGVL